MLVKQSQDWNNERASLHSPKNKRHQSWKNAICQLQNIFHFNWASLPSSALTIRYRGWEFRSTDFRFESSFHPLLHLKIKQFVTRTTRERHLWNAFKGDGTIGIWFCIGQVTPNGQRRRATVDEHRWMDGSGRKDLSHLHPNATARQIRPEWRFVLQLSVI